MADSAEVKMPRDGTGRSIQALHPTTAQTVTVTATTAVSGANFGANCEVVELTPTEDMFIKFGDSTVEATSGDIFLRQGSVYTYAVKGDTRVAAIRSATSGTLYITELT